MDVLQAMRVFAKVVELDGFSRAAQRLGISATAASRLVADLEARLGVRLLHRTTRRLYLTDSGRSYYERCTHILNDLDEAELSITSAAGRPQGLLRVSAPVSFGIKHLTPLFLDYMERYPEVKLELSLTDSQVDLVEEGYDLALRITHELKTMLVARPLAPARLVVCAAPAYLKRHGAPRTPEELRHHECLRYTYDAVPGIWEFTGPTGRIRISVAGPLATNNGDTLRAAALAGRGIIMEPTFQVGEDLRLGRLVRLLPEYPLCSLTLYAVYPSRRYLSPKVRTLVDFLVERIAEPLPWDAWMRNEARGVCPND
ncbi:LysR family transcriptional regulator [Archangium violaceum]|uniref:LysR family transcriptional regulator n=1 Tax=Archangium violaceum TaxID=83451 RepID=UPI00193B3590|nr:LysR family transcriptional regulator [Archangium violaceum]QRK09474.1 LysR family transcriptional regulator [Archangium violaceum]